MAKKKVNPRKGVKRKPMKQMLEERARHKIEILRILDSSRRIPPTINEIAKALNISYKSAERYVNAMRDERLLERESNIARSITITEAGQALIRGEHAPIAS